MKIVIPNNGRIQAKCDVDAQVVISITIQNITFTKILHYLCGVPVGRKTKIIGFCPLIFDSPISLKKSVLKGIYDCEGYVGIHSKSIVIDIQSQDYIKGIVQLLRKFGIDSHIGEKSKHLLITGWKNILSFKQKINFITQKRKKDLTTLLSSYKKFVFRKKEGVEKILDILSKQNNSTINLIAKELKKDKTTVFKYINRGIKMGFILKNSKIRPFVYSLTTTGSQFLEKQRGVSSER